MTQHLLRLSWHQKKTLNLVLRKDISSLLWKSINIDYLNCKSMLWFKGDHVSRTSKVGIIIMMCLCFLQSGDWGL